MKTPATRLLIGTGNGLIARKCDLSRAQIEKAIAALEGEQQLIITRNGSTYVTSMTPGYMDGEEVLASKKWRDLSYWEDYAIQSFRPSATESVIVVNVRPLKEKDPNGIPYGEDFHTTFNIYVSKKDWLTNKEAYCCPYCGDVFLPDACNTRPFAPLDCGIIEKQTWKLIHQWYCERRLDHRPQPK